MEGREGGTTIEEPDHTVSKQDTCWTNISAFTSDTTHICYVHSLKQQLDREMRIFIFSSPTSASQLANGA